MHVEILVEEPSVQAALGILVPKILGSSATFEIHAYEGKPDLLGKLPARLKGYASWMPEDWRIVVLVDEDRENCLALKSRLEEAAAAAGLRTRSAAGSGEKVKVINRIALEELEAWFFGDIDGLRSAYPRVPPSLAARARYRKPDVIAGGTWEALERVLQAAGYHQGGLRKIAAAQAIASHMDPERNASPSFRQFKRALDDLLKA